MKISLQHRQSGTVLFISLVILSVITLVAVTGMRTSITEEKMSGNLRAQEFAMQAAESAMLNAFTVIEGLPNRAALTGANGLIPDGIDFTEPDYFSDNTWSTAANFTDAPDLASGQLADAPKWIIKYIGERPLCGPATGLDPDNPIGDLPECRGATFRVTVQGTGLTPNSTKLLQGYYQRSLPF